MCNKGTIWSPCSCVCASGKLQYLGIASLDEVFQVIGALKILIQRAATGVGYVVMASCHLAQEMNLGLILGEQRFDDFCML